MMAHNLYHLGTILSNPDYVKLSQSMMGKVKKMVMVEPQYLTNWACLFSQMTSPMAEIAIVGNDLQEKSLSFFESFLPNKVLVGSSEAGSSALELLQQRSEINQQTTIYVCFDKTCQLPVNSVAEALQLIEKGS
jgi:hypothetical protein